MRKIEATIGPNSTLAEAYQMICPEGFNWENDSEHSSKLIILYTKSLEGEAFLTQLANLRVFIEMVSKKLTEFTGSEPEAKKLFSLFKPLDIFLDGVETGYKSVREQIR